MFCIKCGEILSDNARRCPVCGASQKANRSKVNEDCDCDTNKGLTFNMSRPKTHSTFRPNATVTQKPAPSFFEERRRKVGFEECLQALKTFFLHYADFKGRTSFREFRATFIIQIGIAIALAFVGDAMLAFWCLLVTVPNIALAARRLNDTDHGRWWMLLIGPIFPIGTVILLYSLCQPSRPQTWAEAK